MTSRPSRGRRSAASAPSPATVSRQPRLPQRQLAQRLELHVEVDNDANLGALAEASFGAGRGLKNIVYVMLGSGIGAGLVLDGRVHRGTAGLAGEIGHVQVRPDGAVCRCGNRG